MGKKQAITASEYQEKTSFWRVMSMAMVVVPDRSANICGRTNKQTKEFWLPVSNKK